jgi:PAS domain S-box-containing protein
MKDPIRILHLEDAASDAELIASTLKRKGLSCSITLVETKKDFEEQLARGNFDIILSDYNLPNADGLSALKSAREKLPHTPFILVTGELSEEEAITFVTHGATDYVMKDGLIRLVPAITRALVEEEIDADRRKSEEALRAAHETILNQGTRLEAVIESLSEGLSIYDPNGDVLSMNRAALKIHGFSSLKELKQHKAENPDAFEVRDMRGLLLPRMESPLGLALRGETFANRLFQVVRKDTGKRWIGNYGGAPVYDSNGALILAIVTVHDDTEFYGTQEALRESENRYRTLVESSPDAIIVHRNGIFLYANDAALRMYGASSFDKLREKSLIEVVHPDDRAVVNARLRQLEAGGFTTARKLRLLRLDGELVHAEAMGGPVNFQGEPAIQTILRDVTERVQAEEELVRSRERFRTLFTSMSEGFALAEIILDEHGKANDYRWLELNPAYEKHTGIPANEAIGKTARELIPNIEQYLIDIYGRVSLTGKPVRFQNFDERTGRWFEIYAFCPEHGKFAHLILDITERRKVEEAFRDSEGRSRLAQEAGHVGIFDWDPLSGKTIWTDTLEEIFGLAPGTFEGTYDAWTRRMHPDDVKTLSNQFVRWIREHQTDVNFEYRFFLPNGELRYMESHARFIYGERDEIIHLIGTNVDITGRKKADEARRESEERYRSIFNGMTEGFALHEIIRDKKGNPTDYRFLEMNPAFEQLTGLKRENVIGKLQSEVIPDEDPSWLEKFSEVALTGKSTHIENYSRAFKRHFEVSAYCPAPLQFAVLFMDITTRKKVEEHFRASQERLRMAQIAGKIGAYTWDIGTDTVSFSEELEALYGLPPGGLGKSVKSWEQYVHPNDFATYKDNLKKIVAGRRVIPMEFRILRKDGVTRWLTSWGKMVFDVQGQPIHIVGILMDITDRKEAEEALKYSEELWRGTVNAANDAIVLFDEELRIIQYNDAVTRIYGYNDKELLGKSVEELRAPETRVTVRTHVRKALEENGTKYETLHRKKNGSVFPVVISTSVYSIGGEKRFLEAIHDISGLKLAEVTLKQSEVEFQAIFQLAAVGIAQAEPFTGKFILVNQKFCEITGFSDDELLQKTNVEITYPADRENDAAILKRVYSGVTDQWVNEKRYLRKDGSVIWVRVTGRLVRDVSGKPFHTIGIIQDITAQKQSYERIIHFQRISAALSGVSTVEDASHVLLREILPAIGSNAGAVFIVSEDRQELSLLGSAGYTAAIMRKWRKIPLDSKTQFTEAFQNRKNLIICSSEERDSRYKDEWKLYGVEENGTSVAIPLLVNGEPIGVVYLAFPNDRTISEEEISFFQTLVFHAAQSIERTRLSDAEREAHETTRKETSHRKRMEDDLHQMQSELEKRVEERTEELRKMNDELETFSYTISHDLKAPLRSITGYTKMLLSESAERINEQQKKHISGINKSAGEMGELLEKILDFALASKQELKRSKVNMRRLIEGVIKEKCKADPGRSIRIVINECHTVHADRTLVRQVLVNLIDNAMKFTRQQKKPAIEIGSSLHNDECVYYVKDNGAGFDMKHYDKLFIAFKRLHPAKEFEGTGIGLAFASRIIKRHGGRIWAEGKAGEGATFYFSLPA